MLTHTKFQSWAFVSPRISTKAFAIQNAAILIATIWKRGAQTPNSRYYKGLMYRLGLGVGLGLRLGLVLVFLVSALNELQVSSV